MPRGVTKSFTEKIADLEERKSEIQLKMDSLQTKLNDLDSKIDEIRKIQKQKEVEELLDAITASGKTPQEFIASFKSEIKAS